MFRFCWRSNLNVTILVIGKSQEQHDHVYQEDGDVVDVGVSSILHGS